MQKERIIFRLGTELRQALQEYADHYGQTEAGVIRQSVTVFLESQGYMQPRAKGGKRKKKKTR